MWMFASAAEADDAQDLVAKGQELAKQGGVALTACVDHQGAVFAVGGALLVVIGKPDRPDGPRAWKQIEGGLVVRRYVEDAV